MVQADTWVEKYCDNCGDIGADTYVFRLGAPSEQTIDLCPACARLSGASVR